MWLRWMMKWVFGMSALVQFVIGMPVIRLAMPRHYTACIVEVLFQKHAMVLAAFLPQSSWTT
jgi:hypothetical protein